MLNWPRMNQQTINLIGILKKEIGNTFYSPNCGEIIIDKVTSNYIHTHLKKYKNEVKIFHFDGIEYKTDGRPAIFPSENLYKKYPTNHNKAWLDWLDNNSPGRAHYGNLYYYITDTFIVASVNDLRAERDNNHYNCGNYFIDRNQAEKVAVELRKRFKHNFIY